MKVILAQPRGFCAGVVRAIEIVERALQRFGAPVYVHHEIVHNRHVVEDLRGKGAIFVEDLSEVPEGAHAIFSAHGVGRSVEAAAARRGLQVLDATCPLVSKVHGQGRRHAAEGRTVVLIGHAGHPEVVGTLDQIPGKVVLVQSVDEAEVLDLPADAPLAYVSQTTLSVDDTRRIIDVLRRRFSQLVGPSVGDICYATQNRQNAVRELLARVDLVLVVGSPHSSNSRRLQEIAAESGCPSYLLADGSELRPEWLHGRSAIGLTAGASAPEASVEDVIAALRRLGPMQLETMDGRSERAVFPLPVVLESVA
ncbi:4-hydroxy-3-methylbut-2-enyl diphosphate reductase [Dyella sp. C9]|uniref:4-hydroxy-3-methylbut-2-enyl diphosphate reductase n=1 Tax=Dyella sp. C9 TaxID=2202154 RepID=UPI000DEFD6E0|nr:4-hydroxy-3-methylbut-2-enyl diphosphate reductase [Dyella sp. C9]